MPKTLNGKILLCPISLQNTTDCATSLQFYLPETKKETKANNTGWKTIYARLISKTLPQLQYLIAVLLASAALLEIKPCPCSWPTCSALLRSWLLTSNIEDQDMIVHHRPNKTGFKKVDPDRWEFASEGFLRGQKHLLKTLKRRRAPSNLSSQHSSAQLLEVGQFGFDREIDQLRRDKSILMIEIVKLRQEQQNMRAHLIAMEASLQGTEQKQQQMMAFLARALHNPIFLHQLAQRNDRNKEFEQAILKKRRRPIYLGSTNCNGGTSSGLEWSARYEVSELEKLALEMQGFRRSSESGEEHEDRDEGELTDEFWLELLSEGMPEQGASNSEGNEDGDDVNVLAEQMGYMSSFSPR